MLLTGGGLPSGRGGDEAVPGRKGNASALQKACFGGNQCPLKMEGKGGAIA